MILSFKKFDNLLLYLSLKVGVNFMNSQHLRLKWHFEKLDKYGPWSVVLSCAPWLLTKLFNTPVQPSSCCKDCNIGIY